MTGSQINCFLAVAEHNSFSKAANALYVSQPAVSKNISTLEAEMGTVLFDRQGKYVVLTKAGEIFLSFLQEYHREYGNMLERIKALDRGTHSGTIRIGCDQTWNAAHFYTRLVRHFSIHYPGVQIQVEGMGPENFLPALRRKDIDVAIMYGYDLERQSDIEADPLTDIGSGFIFSTLIGSGKNANIESLAEMPFLFASDPGNRVNSEHYRHTIMELCRRHGFTPETRACKSYSSAFVEVSCGNGVLFVDEWSSMRNNPEYCYIPAELQIPICMAHLPTASNSLLKLFIEEARRVFTGNY